jgi:ketosteroid isomerase-like protein
MVLARAGELLDEPPLTFALSNVEVKVSGRLARVDADLALSIRGGGEQRRELRHSRVRLAKHADRWQIEAIEVDPIVPSEPEARP